MTSSISTITPQSVRGRCSANGVVMVVDHSFHFILHNFVFRIPGVFKKVGEEEFGFLCTKGHGRQGG